MDSADAHDVAQDLRARVGAPLRACIFYEYVERSVDVDVLYRRPDVDSEYDPDEYRDVLADVVGDIALESVSTEWFERRHEFEELYMTVRVFDAALVAHVTCEEGTGLVVSVDPDAMSALSAVRDVVRPLFD